MRDHEQLPGIQRAGVLGTNDMIDASDLFESGTQGYHTFRIPALITTLTGTVLAFCEGRKNARGDTGDIDMLLRRSDAGGQTFAPLFQSRQCRGASEYDCAAQRRRRPNVGLRPRPASRPGRVLLSGRFARRPRRLPL